MYKAELICCVEQKIENQEIGVGCEWCLLYRIRELDVNFATKLSKKLNLIIRQTVFIIILTSFVSSPKPNFILFIYVTGKYKRQKSKWQTLLSHKSTSNRNRKNTKEILRQTWKRIFFIGSDKWNAISQLARKKLVRKFPW